MIVTHLSTFAGLPVVELDVSDDLQGVSDGEVAWRVSVESWEPEEPYDEMFVRFLESVDTEDVQALVIGCWGFSADTSAERPVELLCDAARWFPSLRAVFLGDMESEESEISWINQTDVTPLLEAFPDLEMLRVRGSQGLRLRPVRHERLRHLGFESGGLPGNVVRAAGAAEFPALKHAELWLGAEQYGGDWTLDDLEPVLAGEGRPALRYLGLADSERADEVAARVATAPVLAGLDTLDLSKGILTDTGAEALLTSEAVRGLRHLDLHHHYLSDEMMARLIATLGTAGVEVDLSDPQKPDDYDFDPGVAHRYAAVTE